MDVLITYLNEDGSRFNKQVARDRQSVPLRIEGDNLPWQKARILLQLAMQKTEAQGLAGAARLAEIQRLMDTH
jgi:hypothetical protein